MTDALRFVPPRVQLADPRTGMITREWYLFFQGVFDRIGGANGQSSTDLVQDMPDDAGLEEAKATMFNGFDALNQTPPSAQLVTLDNVLAELQAQRDTLSELIKTVQDLQQGAQL